MTILQKVFFQLLAEKKGWFELYDAYNFGIHLNGKVKNFTNLEDAILFLRNQ